jgi:hypothetical protein
MLYGHQEKPCDRTHQFCVRMFWATYMLDVCRHGVLHAYASASDAGGQVCKIIYRFEHVT